jgi:uncharacterized membrane protein
MMDLAVWGLIVAVFAACLVEAVEATTIVMAMGYTRSWRSAWLGVAAALGALAVFTVIAGYALVTWLEPAVLKLVVGTLLLIFGFQWLRKAIYRASGRKAIHDEDLTYREEVAAAKAAGRTKEGIDPFSFFVSFKGAFLEGLEVVFIVITFGLSARVAATSRTVFDPLWLAAAAALLAVLVVVTLAFAVRRPLSMIPENTLKYGVSLLLVSFGLFWSIGGLGAFFDEADGIEWPGSDAAILVIIVVVFVLSRVLVAVFRRGASAKPAHSGVADAEGGHE